MFWILWLLDLLAVLFGYREFIGDVFGRYASASSKYMGLWAIVLIVSLLILGGSLYLKNREQSSAALIVAAIPLMLALPYALFLAATLGGKNKWN